MKKRILALLLTMVMLLGMLPVSAFATEATDPTEDCSTEGCTYGAKHEGNCSNFVACETEGCEYAAGHEGNCSNYVEPTEACRTEGCTYGADHEGKCSNFVACGTEGCEYAAGHEGNCSNAVSTSNIEPVSTTVSFSAQQAGSFLAAPQLSLDVSSDTAENYGYTDQTDMASQVSTMDVLVAAHVAAYGDSFTKDSASNYLISTGNFITKMFGSDNGGNVCLLVNGFQPGNNGVEQAVVKNGDLVELFVYQNAGYKDKYVWLAMPDGTKADGQSVYGGKTVQIAVRGYSPFSYGYDGDDGETMIPGATIYMVDVNTGNLTSLGVVTGDDGTASITIPASYIGQTVYLTAKGSEMAMTLSKVTIAEPPASEDFKLTSLEIAVGGNSVDTAAVQTLTPEFEGATTEYSTPILNYEGDKNNRFVWLKVSAPEGATVTAKCGKSNVTTLTSGEWGVVQVQGGYFFAPTYSGCLTPGEYNKVLITVSKEGETDKVYTVTVPMQPDISNQSLRWATDLKDTLYITKDDADAVLTVEAAYQNRPLENTDVISYQWYTNTTASNEGGTAIEGANAATYVPAVSQTGSSYYYVTASCGELESITSNVITVTVTEEAAPKSVSVICEHPYTVPDTWIMALGGVKYIAKPGDTLTLKAVDENGKETPVTWPSSLGGGTLDRTTGSSAVYTIKNTSYSYVKVTSLYDPNLQSEEKVIQVLDYSFSDYSRTPSVILSNDGQSTKQISTQGGISGSNIWSYTISPENAAVLDNGVTEKSNWVYFNALRPGTITVSFDLDLDGDGMGDGNGLTDSATMTINGIAVEDDAGHLTKTYLEISAASSEPTVQLKALSSTENAVFTWSSADEAVATVDENGLVTAKGVGSVIISANDGTYTGGIKVVVTSADTPYFEQIDFTTTNAWGSGLSSATWTTASFKPATLEYTGLKLTKASASTLSMKETTLYNTEKYAAVATYTDANGDDRSITVNSGAATNLPDISFETSTITITLTDKTDETRKTVYTFEINRPRDTTKTIATNGITFTPDGREIWKDKYNEKTEGIMYVANEDGSFAQYQGVSSSRYYYRTYALNGLESFVLALKGGSVYTHIRISTDNGESWTYLGQSGTTGISSGKITIPAPTGEEHSVVRVMIQLLDDATYAANIAAQKDGFADSTPTTYSVWVEQIPELSAACDIVTAVTDYGDWYPTFAPVRTGYRILVAPEAEAPVLTYTVSEGAKVTIDGVEQTPNEAGEYTLTLTETSLDILVAASDGMSTKTYSFGYSHRESVYVPDKVVDFLSVNSQYINGGYGSNPQQALTGGLLSLGNFGGYVTFYLENGLTDDPTNTYGVDFYVNGNAFKDTSTGSGLGSMEPGQVWVSEDGSTWYALAGSEHYEPSTIWNYSVTYTKTETGSTDWMDNYGNTMASTHGRSFAWPSPEVYTMNDYAARDSFTLSGILIPCVDGSLTGTDNFGSYSKGGKFGYADLIPNGTANPYLNNTNLTNESSGFDLAWAVDGAGNPVDVSGKSFHYVKVVTASNLMAGAANEKSTEVGSLVRATGSGTAVGKTAAPTGVTFANGEEIYAYTFEEGKQVYEISVPSGMTTATIRVDGTAEDDNIYINNQWLSSGAVSREYSFNTDSQKLIRIIVQNGEKEPVIYLLKVKESVEEEIIIPQLSELVFRNGIQATKQEFALSPAFDPAVREYTLVIPDSVSATGGIALWATLKENTTGQISANYTSLTNSKDMAIKVTSGKTSGTAMMSLFKPKDLTGNELIIKIDDVEAYTINIVRRPTLSALSFAANGEVYTLNEALNALTTEYSAIVPPNTELAVNAEALLGNITVKVDGAETTVLTPEWNGRTYDLTITLSAEGAQDTVYTVHLNQAPSKLEMVTAPVKTEYHVGEMFDIAGLELKAVYADGNSEAVPVEKISYEPTGPLDQNVTAIVLSYNSTKIELPVKIISELKGSGTQEDPFLIYTAEDYQAVYEMVAAGLSLDGQYLKQMADIILPADWKPIGVLIDPSVGNIGSKGANMNPFSGNLDGNGKTLTIPEGGLPLLGYVKNASVKNLNIYGKKIAGYGLVNNLEGVGLSGNAITIENVTLKSGSSTLKSGLIGTYLTNNPYGGCSSSFVVTIKNCTIEKDVVIGYNKDQSQIGSIAGRINGTIENCVSYATVYGVDYVGGILGTRDNALGTCSVTSSQFHGTIIATGEHAGGIFGGGYQNSTAPNGIHTDINDCSVSGSVTGKDKVGGITGGDSFVAQAWNPVTFKNNSFTGTVKAIDGNYVGGIIGYYLSLNKMDDITGNYYKMGCGADKGIGFVQYVDTSFTAHETQSGATYINTETSTSECPKVTGCAWKKAHNRTDDPLGADKAKLCYTDTDTDPIAVKLEVSGTYKTEYVLGDTLDLTGIVLTVHYNWGDPEIVPLADATVSGYDADEVGEQELTISYSGLTATIKIKVVNPVSEIKVTVSVLGDSVHDSDSDGKVHTLAGGNLTTWVSAKTYTVDANSTVWDVLQTVFAANGITCNYKNSLGTVYITSLTRNGVTLGEFTNGVNSGWQYTLNGAHPLNSVAQQYLKDGDVVLLHYTDDYTKEQGSSGEEEDDGTEAIEKVQDLINAIGTVTLNSKDKIDAARAAYDALTYAQKQEVSNYTKLTDAEAKYAELKKADDEKKADAVEALIDKIDTEIALDSEAEITAARKAYDALTADQKKLVSNYKKLTDAEYDLALLKADKKDKEAAEAVEKLIDAIGTVTLDSEEKVKTARAAYDKLTDIQKALVKNYGELEEAEAKLAELKTLADIEDIYKTTGDYLENLGTPIPGSVGGEWMVIGLIRSGRQIKDADAYYDAAVKYVQENIDENERLHHAKSTENSRMILALTAMGKDVTNVGGHNLLTGLNNMEYVCKQGINGPIWALLALDSGNYAVPDGDVTREALIQVILDAQLSDGGWALSGTVSDADITGMALQALAPYYKTDADVKKAVDDSILTLSMMQAADGSFASIDGSSSESIAQVITGLSALGIDVDTDPRFIKNGNSALDALCAFFVEGGGFKHIPTGKLDGMATEQSYYALTAYFRMVEGKTALFDMTDVLDMGGDVAVEEPVETQPTETEPASTESVKTPDDDGRSFPWWLVIVIVVLGGAIVVLVIISKPKKGSYVR